MARGIIAERLDEILSLRDDGETMERAAEIVGVEFATLRQYFHRRRIPWRQKQQGHSMANDALKSFIDRIETLDGERRVLSQDIKEIFEEAKGAGYEPAAMREILRKRRMDQEKRARLSELVSQYELALGM